MLPPFLQPGSLVIAFSRAAIARAGALCQRHFLPKEFEPRRADAQDRRTIRSMMTIDGSSRMGSVAAM